MESLFKDKQTDSKGRTTALLNVKLATVAKTNVRKEYVNEKEEIKKLSQSIEKHGLKQRVTCTFEGKVFIGKRRLEAVRSLKWDWIPCEIDMKADSFEQRMASYVENKERKNMSVTQEAMILQAMCKDRGISASQLAREIGEPERTVRRRIQILKVLQETVGPTEIVYGTGKKEDLKKLTMNKAEMLSRDWIPNESRKKLIEKIISEGMAETELAKVINTTKAYYPLIEDMPEEEKKELTEKLGDKLFTKELSLPEITHAYNEVTGSSQKLTKQYFEKDFFKSLAEAEAYARKYNGRCNGLKEYWELEYDTFAEKQEKIRKEVEKNETEESTGKAE